MAAPDPLTQRHFAGTQPTAAARGGVDGRPRVLVLGGSGFIGSRIAAALADSGAARVVALSRRPQGPGTGSTSVVAGDIEIPDSLDPVMEAVDVVVHSASYVGRDPQLAQSTNVDGTCNVLAACARAGVPRIIYVSTAAVYGMGPHRGVREEVLGYNPASATSDSRAAAEQLVLEHGGDVVRPNLVLGSGDRWVVPGLVKMMASGGAWPGNGSALLSIVDVADLGRLVGSFALAGRQERSVFHAANPEPVATADLLRAIAMASNAPMPAFAGQGQPAGPELGRAGFSPHQVDMVAVDHWYRSGRLWHVAGLTPPSPGEAVGRIAGSYPGLRPAEIHRRPAQGRG
ncbi:NAD-dependent epimerase/dehydratase family protein [Arthrobacter sp. 35W]|uniref:NAD-dependent epimerase/dehydratase family protein n=1 Tax=Arthrobacter sp. 35W TaxID=1132441 RepID=UPI0006875EF3|nr:NAD(P)-dependent oxidoreductase [Arthrobacter sp. 35W]